MPLELQQVALLLGGQTLIQAFDLAIARSEIVTLMGPSGSGKSSLLSYVAGDLAPPLTGHGQVRLGGTDISTALPAQRHIGRLFQDDLLFPHMSVAENLLFGVPRGQRRAREQKMRASLAEVDLVGFEHRSPASLSGGQRQRVALMRALLAEPSAMLLDEPFNKLDEELRQSMRELVFSRIAAANIPCLLVTHDRADAPPGGRTLRISREGLVQHV